jgi:surfeit locus 1 family protein
MAFGDLELRLGWLTSTLAAILVPLFVGLGIWQLERAQEKRELAETLAARLDLPALSLEKPVSDTERLRFRTLTATGIYEPDGQILLENRRYGQRTGFHVITPLRIAGEDLRVLVNRGWIPADATGLPTHAPVPEGTRTIKGQTHIPESPALVLHGADDAAASWGERWPYLTLDLYAETVDFPIQPVVVLLDPEDEGGFARSWPREFPREGMHIGYALQWFAFAVFTLVIYLRFSIERRKKREQ